jgi:hypothetical protein
LLLANHLCDTQPILPQRCAAFPKRLRGATWQAYPLDPFSSEPSHGSIVLLGTKRVNQLL